MATYPLNKALKSKILAPYFTNKMPEFSHPLNKCPADNPVQCIIQQSSSAVLSNNPVQLLYPIIQFLYSNLTSSCVVLPAKILELCIISTNLVIFVLSSYKITLCHNTSWYLNYYLRCIIQSKHQQKPTPLSNPYTIQ